LTLSFGGRQKRASATTPADLCSFAAAFSRWANPAVARESINVNETEQHAADGDPKAALIALKNAIRKSPQSLPGLALLGSAILWLGFAGRRNLI
jgi:cytochrome c-type biogenesis protein CcmH/NrfG